MAIPPTSLFIIDPIVPGVVGKMLTPLPCSSPFFSFHLADRALDMVALTSISVSISMLRVLKRAIERLAMSASLGPPLTL